MSPLSYYECPLDAEYMMKSLCECKSSDRRERLQPILDASKIFDRLEKMKIYIPVDIKTFKERVRNLCSSHKIEDIPNRLKAPEGEFVNGQLQLILENIMAEIEEADTKTDKARGQFYQTGGRVAYRLDVSREQPYDDLSGDTYDVLLSIERYGAPDFRIWIESDSSRDDQLALKILKLRHIIDRAKPSDFFVSWIYFTHAQITRKKNPRSPTGEFEKHAKKLFSLNRKMNLPISLAVFVCKETRDRKYMDLEIRESRNGTKCLWPIVACSNGTSDI